MVAAGHYGQRHVRETGGELRPHRIAEKTESFHIGKVIEGADEEQPPARLLRLSAKAVQVHSVPDDDGGATEQLRILFRHRDHAAKPAHPPRFKALPTRVIPPRPNQPLSLSN